jgi:phosphomannomutase/phosphoglucomutase
MLFAADVLTRRPGATVIYDVKSTRNLGPWIIRHGGVPMLWKTGHSLIKSKMKEVGAALAGEMSGHTFFAERWYGFDDGLYAGARLLGFCRGTRILRRCSTRCRMRCRRPS